MLTGIKKAWIWFWRALFPSRCLFCRDFGAFVCENCQKELPLAQNPRTFLPESTDEHFFGLHLPHPQTERLLYQWKYEGKHALSGLLADLFLSVQKKFPQNVALVPIPLHWTRKLWRGWNQSEHLARHIAQKTGNTMILGLKRPRKTAQQAKLNKKERAENTKNIFTVTKALKNQTPSKKTHIIIVDDVCASGATLKSAIKTLQAAGYTQIQTLSLAKTEKNHEKRDA